MPNTETKKPLNKKKQNIRVTISPYIYEKMEKLVGKNKFSSMSDLVSVAVTKLLAEFPEEEVKS